ncbi:MAG: hypothetical protein JWN14_1390 [Chthonomonadales bacterium]|nr:hypothetical protein [Chthonomonadales bacterium]
MFIMSHVDKRGNAVLDDLLWDHDELNLVLAEPGVNRKQVLKSIRPHGARVELGRPDWAIIGGLETLRQLNVPNWLAQAEMIVQAFLEMDVADESYIVTADGQYKS